MTKKKLVKEIEKMSEDVMNLTILFNDNKIDGQERDKEYSKRFYAVLNELGDLQDALCNLHSYIYYIS